MINVYESIDECNPNKKRKVIIVFGDMIADTISKQKLQPIVT